MFSKRRFPRLRKDFQVAYTLVDQEKFHKDPISTLVLNISGGGVCFEAIDRLEEGALVFLDVRSDDFTAPFLALAKVVWCTQRGERYRVGVEFWWVGWGDNHVQAAVANYIATHMTPSAMSVLATNPAQFERLWREPYI